VMRRVTAKHPLQSSMYTEIKGSNPSMPPRGYTALTDQEIFMIKAWISMGALNQSNCTVCDTTQFKFTADIQPIMNTYCVGCHSTSNAGGGADLSNYTGVVNSINNKLMGTIKHSAGYNAMPQNGNQLSGCQISKIQSWVNAGHPND
ncbi:MAG TPA: cytochrome c, partial [Bacteroidia bacterium]|nr:cytochrome c [Bacteroidia bacterium]